MGKLDSLKPAKVFEYFEKLAEIPHGSGNMKKISDWCIDFANKRGLRAIKDSACNVIIYKNGTHGHENLAPVILQGHLDMVCQKNPDCDFDFEKDGLDLLIDGDFVKANGTTLGADNGIAVAMILALLDSHDIPHPPIEAVFTTDEEVGMLGAMVLDMNLLKAARMINLDSEDMDTVTVACAGGMDFTAEMPLVRTSKEGFAISIILDGLEGGHSGVEIGKNRTNAAILLGRVLNHLSLSFPYDIITLSGGDRSNVITRRAMAQILVKDTSCEKQIKEYLNTVKTELSASEPNFDHSIETSSKGTFSIIDKSTKDAIVSLLSTSPQGVAAMSAEIPGLVETSQNLGILTCTDQTLTFGYSLRSSKTSALLWLEERMRAHFSRAVAKCSTGGAYPPWEFCNNSSLQKVYNECFSSVFGKVPDTVSIHAGLECGIFSSKIKNFDCISIGPELHDIHTPLERMSISSVEKLWRVLLKVLENLE